MASIGLTGCLNMKVMEMNWHISLQDHTVPLEGYSVVLIIRGYDGEEERFGPAVTDLNGECRITVPEHSRPLKFYALHKPSLWLEVQAKNGETGLGEAASILGDRVVFELKTAREPTPQSITYGVTPPAAQEPRHRE